MALSLTRAAIKAVSGGAYEMHLKVAGFRRQSNHAHRATGDLIHAVHFQASQWGSAVEGRFTINLSVTSAFLYDCWTGKPLPRNPATALFPIQRRIGRLMPERTDRWWDVTPVTSIDELTAEIALALRNYALPFFDAYSDTAALLDAVRRDRAIPGATRPQIPLIHAMLAKQAGHDDEAWEQLQAAYTDAGSSPFRFTVAFVAERLGLRIGKR